MNSYRFSDLRVGMEEKFEFDISQDKVEKFREISGDGNPLHTDAEFARLHGFSDRVVYGLLSASVFSTLGGCHLPGKYCIIEQVELKFTYPVYVGDRLTVIGEVEELNESVQQAVLKVTVTNQENRKVIRGLMKVGFLEG